MNKQLLYSGLGLSVLVALGILVLSLESTEYFGDDTQDLLTDNNGHIEASGETAQAKLTTQSAAKSDVLKTTNSLNSQTGRDEVMANRRSPANGLPEEPVNYINGNARLSLQDRNYNSTDTYVAFVSANKDATPDAITDDVITDWQKELPVYGNERVSELYPGIDLLFYQDMGRTDFDIQVAPGADVSMVKLDFGNGTIIKRGSENELLINYPDGDTTLVMNRPVSWQYIDGAKKRVQSQYDFEGSVVSIELGNYDALLPVVID